MKSESKVKIILNFSVKNSTIGHSYQILLEGLNKSLGLKEHFKTELLKCNISVGELMFKEKLTLNFNFAERQKLNINFIKRIPVDEKLNYKIQCLKKETELASIISSPYSIYERCLNKKEKNKDIFCIKAIKVDNENEENINIYDFIKSGIKLNIFVAFDFSEGVNRQPRQKSINNYAKFLSNFTSKIFHYSKRQSLYLYGYGGKLNNNEDLFNFSSEDDKPIYLSDASKIYESKHKNIIPKKNVIFSKLIRKITNIIYKLYEVRNYNVLIIFIRELPDAKDKTELIDAFIESSYLPLTLLLIGEGKNDFQRINEFFGSHIKEASSGMERNKRNNIAFTNFYNNLNENEEELTQWCLEEISKQMIEFYDLINITAKQIWENNVKAIEESFIQYNKVSINIYESYMKNSNLESHIYENKNSINLNKINDEDLKEEGKEKNEINEIKEINPKKEIIHKDKGNINKSLKFTPGGSININLVNINNPYNSKNNSKKPSESLKEEEYINNIETYKLTPGRSTISLFPNPYNPKKREEKETYNPDFHKQNYIIPEESTCLDMLTNPYHKEKNKVEEKQTKESKIESYNISTEESSKLSNNLNLKVSSGIRFALNYSVDN